MNIQAMLTPYNFTRMSNRNIKYIVIHYVGAVSTAKNNAEYYAREKLKSSAHYFVDETSIWQSVEDKNNAWHCGGGLQGKNGHKYHGICTNSNSIGIEMCVKKDANGNWYFEPGTVKNTIDLVKFLMKKHNIAIGNVIRHYDVTGKNCPAPFIDESKWGEFKDMIIPKPEIKTANDIDYALKWKYGITFDSVENEKEFIKQLDEARENDSKLYWVFHKLANK